MIVKTEKNYTTSVGQKFNPDGTVREFRGNTVICHIPKDSSAFKMLLWLGEQSKSQPWGNKFSFLPPSSYHMTIFDGVCDQVRQASRWTSHLPLDAALYQVDELLLKKWPEIEKPEGISMRYRLFYTTSGYIGLFVDPITMDVERKLRRFRNQLSDAFGIRHPDHNDYAFHITLAYGIEVLNLFEKIQAVYFAFQMHRILRRDFGIVHLNTPELTRFDDMACFLPILLDTQPAKNRVSN